MLSTNFNKHGDAGPDSTHENALKQEKWQRKYPISDKIYFIGTGISQRRPKIALQCNRICLLKTFDAF